MRIIPRNKRRIARVFKGDYDDTPEGEARRFRRNRYKKYVFSGPRKTPSTQNRETQTYVSIEFKSDIDLNQLHLLSSVTEHAALYLLSGSRRVVLIERDVAETKLREYFEQYPGIISIVTFVGYRKCPFVIPKLPNGF